MKFGIPDEVYKNIKKIVESNPKYKIKIFGSRARGNYKVNSDIDLAVFENVSAQDEFKIRNELDKINTAYKIDLVFVNDKTKKELLKSITEEGVEF